MATAFLGLNQALGVLSFGSVAELVPKNKRGYVIGVMNLSGGGFVICGSLIGHEMVEHTKPGWKTVFWFCLATNIVAAAACYFTYYPAAAVATQGLKKRQILVDFDYIGLLGVIAGPLLILLAIIWVPQYGATDAYFLGPFITGCIVLIALVLYEAYVAKHPLLHPFLFKQVRTFTLMLVIAFVGGISFYALQSFWPTFLTLLWDGNDSTKIGIDGIPFGAGTQVGGVGSALLLPILGPKIGTQWLLAIGVLFQVAFIPAMYAVTPATKGMALAFSCLAGIGETHARCCP